MAWQVLAGVVELWADEGLCEVGRQRGHQARDKRLRSREILPGRIKSTRAAFVARRTPWRMAQLSLDEPESELSVAVAAWADDATAVLRGNPAMHYAMGPNQTWGDSGLRSMLEPSTMEEVVSTPWSARFRLDGGLLEQSTHLVPELVVLGADHYDVIYDRELRLITRWEAIIDDHSARRHVLPS
jgi:hypothetical protein